MENQNSFTGLENQPVFTRRTSTAYVSTSSAILILKTRTSENTSTFLSSDTTTNSSSVSDDYLLIALRKGKHTCTSHHNSRFVSYSHLSHSFYAFIFSLDSYFVLKYVPEALSILSWKDAIKKEMLALEQNET